MDKLKKCENWYVYISLATLRWEFLGYGFLWIATYELYILYKAYAPLFSQFETTVSVDRLSRNQS